MQLKRWALSRQLRAFSRDWTLLPTATSTDRGVLANLFDAPAQSVAEREAGARRTEPSLRWRLRETEGSWWLGYRPVVKVELITPGIAAVEPAVALPVEVEVREPEHELPAEHELPGYEA